jgi:hypothetical protein
MEDERLALPEPARHLAQEARQRERAESGLLGERNARDDRRRAQRGSSTSALAVAIVTPS